MKVIISLVFFISFSSISFSESRFDHAIESFPNKKLKVLRNLFSTRREYLKNRETIINQYIIGAPNYATKDELVKKLAHLKTTNKHLLLKLENSNTDKKSSCIAYIESDQKLFRSIFSKVDELLKTNDKKRKAILKGQLKLLYTQIDTVDSVLYDFFDNQFFNTNLFKNQSKVISPCFCANQEAILDLAEKRRVLYASLKIGLLESKGVWDVFPLTRELGEFVKDDLEKAADAILKYSFYGTFGAYVAAEVFMFSGATYLISNGYTTAEQLVTIASMFTILGMSSALILEAKEIGKSIEKVNKLLDGAGYEEKDLAFIFSQVNGVVNMMPEDHFNLYRMIEKLEEYEHINMVKSHPKKVMDKSFEQLIQRYGTREIAYQKLTDKLKVIQDKILENRLNACQN